MHLFGRNRDHDYYFELPLKGSRTPNQFLGVLLHTMAMYGLSVLIAFATGPTILLAWHSCRQLCYGKQSG